jgi:hypothetical protein
MNNLHESQRRRGTLYREPQQPIQRIAILDKVITILGYFLSCYIGFLIAIYIV